MRVPESELLIRLFRAGLARQIRAGEILLYALSDVPGDAIAASARVRLSPDPESRAQARAIVARYRIPVVPAVADALRDRDDTGREASGGQPATSPAVKGRIVASSTTAVAAAVRAAEAAGWPAQVLPEAYGSAQDTAREHATVIRTLKAGGRRRALISGGETTVSVTRPDGRGGRNGEYLLALALTLGSEAGAQRSHEFFAALDNLVITGPTRTNVNDLRIALVG